MEKIVNCLFLFLFILFFSISCANEPPIVSTPIYKVLVYQKGSLGMPMDSIFLSVFFDLEDENGLTDITEINVIHIESELKWEIPLNQLEEYVWNEKKYYGYSFLEYENAQKILSGEYVIEVLDTAGNTSSTSFTVQFDGLPLNQSIAIKEINYKVDLVNHNELKITNGIYYAVDVKSLTERGIFHRSRKKFKQGQRIILSNEPLPQNSIISLMITKDIEEKEIIFLKDLIF